MSAIFLERRMGRDQWGLKGPQAHEWLAAQGLALPSAPNTVEIDERDDLLVARLGSSEYFIEAARSVQTARLSAVRDVPPPGVYPVLREDWGFDLSGADVHDALAQVCNVNFAAFALEAKTLIMTLMVGVAVLVVPHAAGTGERRYRIWCDPSFGPYLSEALGAVVVEGGGKSAGVSE
jgi:sarcosine oxidase subunit gamma